MAYAARHPAFGHAWRRQAIDPPRVQVVALLRQAIAAGRLSADVDVESEAVALVGPMMYRSMLRMTGGEPMEDLADVIVATLWKAHGKPARRTPRSKR